eukprot:31388-Pelagococcus_subviridis.AAC.15
MTRGARDQSSLEEKAASRRRALQHSRSNTRLLAFALQAVPRSFALVFSRRTNETRRTIARRAFKQTTSSSQKPYFDADVKPGSKPGRVHGRGRGIPPRGRGRLVPLPRDGHGAAEPAHGAARLLVPRLRAARPRRRAKRVRVVRGGVAHDRGRGFLRLVLELLRLAVEEEVDHDVPRVRRGDRAAHLKHHAREEVVEATDRVLGLVVRGDRDVDELQRGVRVAEGDRGEVHVRRLRDRLLIRARIREHEHARLVETLLNLVRVRARSVAARDGFRAGVLRVFEHRALTVRTRGLANDVGGVLDRDEDARGEHELVPRLPEVDDVDAVAAAFPDVPLHLEVAVFRAEMAPGGEHHLDVRLLLGELRHDEGGVQTNPTVRVRRCVRAAQRGRRRGGRGP